MPIDAYLVRPASAADPRVLAFSRGARLPYRDARESPNATAMRAELVEALSGLSAGPGELLHATLVSPRAPHDRADLENILLFNLSSGRALSPSCGRGVRLEHVRRRPVDPTLPGAEHQHIYETADTRAEFRHHEAHDPIARFDWTVVPKWSDIDGARVSEIWLPIRTATERSATADVGRSGRGFGLRLELRASRSHAGGVIKKAVDAVVAAHQAHLGRLDPRVPIVLSEQTGLPASEISELLGDPSTAALGRAPLVHPWGRSIQWSPVDDLLSAIELRLEQIPQGTKWQVRGELFLVTPRASA